MKSGVAGAQPVVAKTKKIEVIAKLALEAKFDDFRHRFDLIAN